MKGRNKGLFPLILSDKICKLPLNKLKFPEYTANSPTI